MTDNKPETFDLDAIPNSKPVASDTALVRKPESSRNVIHDTYQQYTKRVWLLDYSSSMLDGIASLNHQRAHQTKSDLLKEIVVENINEKLADYGEDVLLQCHQFHGHTEQFIAPTLEKLKEVIAGSYADGWATDVFAALEFGVRQCELYPSPVNTHQVLMVTDGLDAGAVEAPVLIPRCKAQNVVVDIIWIRSKHEGVGAEVIAALRQLCVATGGSFIEADTIEDVRRGFVTSANRLCLPPASTALPAGV